MVQCGIFLVALFVGGYALPTSKDVGLEPDLINDTVFDQTVTNIDGRIVGGSVAAEGAYPWMVAITASFMINFFLCGGAIITNRHILTSAHCGNAIVTSAQNARVTVGTNSWANGSTTYGLQIVAINPEYDALTKRNDIGVLGTTINITFNARVTPIPVSYDFVPGGILVRVSGWGWLQAGGTTSEKLQELRLFTMDGESCAAEVRRVAQSIGMIVPRVYPDNQICTFLTGNEGICVGDGGSPLVRNSNNHLIGVASWGVPCARGAPDIFTRVSLHRVWIETVLNFPI